MDNNVGKQIAEKTIPSYLLMMVQDVDQESITGDSKKKIKQSNDGEQTAPPLQKVEKDFLWTISQRPICFAGHSGSLQFP